MQCEKTIEITCLLSEDDTPVYIVWMLGCINFEETFRIRNHLKNTIDNLPFYGLKNKTIYVTNNHTIT